MQDLTPLRIAVIGVLDGTELTAAFPDLVRTHGRVQGIGVGSRAELETFTRAVSAVPCSR